MLAINPGCCKVPANLFKAQSEWLEFKCYSSAFFPFSRNSAHFTQPCFQLERAYEHDASPFVWWVPLCFAEHIALPKIIQVVRFLRFREFMRTVWHTRGQGRIYCSNQHGWGTASTASTSTTATKSGKHGTNDVRQTLARSLQHASSDQCVSG